MKSLTLLWNSVAYSMAARCCTSAHLDCVAVEERTKNEGLSFLTITLPSFGKDFEYCLDQGKVDDSVFLSFKKNRSLPAFLQGFSRLVFDRSTGVLLDNPNHEAIRAIRQLTLMFGKMRHECEPRRTRAAFREYVKCEQEVRELYGTKSFKDFNRISSLLFASMFSKVDKRIYDGDIVPKHGPGATADSLYGNQKYRQMSWPCRLERYFPYWKMVLPSASYFDVMDEVNFLEPDAEIPVKVIAVPKTMKTPRIIAAEPTAMMYAQQGILRLFQEEIKVSYLNSFIGLDDQEPNQLLAKEGSEVGNLATLDLSEASDRVSCESVANMLSPHKHLLNAVLDCRSRRARLPSGEVIPLAKFASMGSALCFPMEAMVFLVAIFLGIEEDLGCPLTKNVVKTFIGRVRVFGDDIIVPKEHVRSVIRSLEYFGLKVNDRKSFWNGKFRESCGKEYYDGTDVSIVRVRRGIPSSRKSVQEIISTVSLRNQLYRVGLGEPVDHLDRQMVRLLGHFPAVGERSPVLGRLHDSVRSPDAMVINSISVVKGWIIRSPLPVNGIDDWPALRKCLAGLEERPVWDQCSDLLEYWDGMTLATSPDHLRRSGRPRVVDIKLGVGSSGDL